jgi:hypothetical protein
MIAIIKGNPTPEEIAALVAVLTLARSTTEPRLTSTFGEWRRSSRLADINLGAPVRRDRRWRPWSAGWSCVGPACAVAPRRVRWAASYNAS